MEFLEFKGKTKDEALMQASVELGVPSTDLEYEVISEETKGFLGIGSKPCIIKARKRRHYWTMLRSTLTAYSRLWISRQRSRWI